MKRRQTGVALVAVMWIISALAVLAAGIAYATRVETRQTQLLRDRAVAAALGDGAINLAVVDMQTNHLGAGGLLRRQYTIDDVTVQVQLIPATGLIDLNSAPEALLRDAFRYAAGLNEDDALILAHRVIDWRDADQSPLPAGAEDDDYFAAGRPEGARDGPFLVNEDLRQVLGVSPDVYDKLSRLINVYPGGSSAINPDAAPPEMLLVLARGDGAVVRDIVDGRRRGDPLSDFSGLTQVHLDASVATLYRMEAYVQVGEGQFMRRVRWVDISAGWGRRPWQVLRVEPVIGATVDPGPEPRLSD